MKEKQKGIKGEIKWFSQVKGYGFITGEDGKDYFVHHSEVSEEDSRQILFEGNEVEFNVKETPKGLQAVGVINQK